MKGGGGSARGDTGLRQSYQGSGSFVSWLRESAMNNINNLLIDVSR